MTQFLLNLFYFLAGLAGLYYGAEFLIKGGVTIARKMGISATFINVCC